MKSTILVIVAHPDDELLWVWWTLLQHIEKGDTVDILILSSWENSRWEVISDNAKRIKQANDVAKKLNAKLFMENFPDNMFDSVPLLNITKEVEKYISEIRPDTIYTHHSNDLNIDHRITFQAVLTSCRPQPHFFVKKIFCFETNSSTEWQKKESGTLFCPNKYVDITNFIDKKLEILSLYEDEIKKFPHPRSLYWVKILSEFRGMEVGYNNAEAFEIIRILD